MKLERLKFRLGSGWGFYFYLFWCGRSGPGGRDQSLIVGGEI